ncbi:hypothetical protein NPIL_628891 [Nephila pilipes]|uniref:SAM-dependent methyltransferase TRM5/TYW2-type domain-containing protein n=1 Tax=Nephila pilipes TaxID=299642 RepID=A0A8X6QQG8_NEPPI|nr:hypothetical protein NPIL_628891 [Nephila pilipes]
MQVCFRRFARFLKVKFVSAHQDIIAKHYSLCKVYSTSVKNMSVEIQTPSVRGLSSIFPPHTVCGMKVLDRDAFRKEITVPSIFVTVDKVGEVIKLIKQNECLLKMDNLQPVQDEGKDKIILLNPDSYEEKYLKIRQCFKKVDINSVSWRKITVTYENWNSQDIFKAILPPNTPGNISGYSIIGHIIHVNLKTELLDFKYVIGQVLLDKHPNIRTVVNKSQIIENEFRSLNFELLAGVPEYEVLVKENHSQFAFDFSKVFWNPRLVKERERIFKNIDSGDLVYDVFAGVGPFAIPLAKQKCQVHANDLNPDSYKWLCHNANLNKVTQYVRAYNLDGKVFIQTIAKLDFLFWMRDRKQLEACSCFNEFASCALVL